MKKRIAAIVFDSKIPAIGESLEIKNSPVAGDDKALCVNIQGSNKYIAVKDTIIDQLGDDEIIAGKELYDYVVDPANGFNSNFNKNIVEGTVVDVKTFTNTTGGTNTAVILEFVVSAPKASTGNKKTEEVDVYSIEFKGSIQAFPAKDALVKMLKNKDPLTESFSVSKKGDQLILFYGNDAVGSSIDLPEEVKNKIKIFDESTKIPAAYNNYDMGKIKVDLQIQDLKVDLSTEFVQERAHALSAGVTGEEFDTYVSLMSDCYGMPAKLIKLVINSWSPINPNYLDRYIPLSRIAVKDKKGKIHPLYIDQQDNVRRSCAYLVSGKSNICYKGEASVGKNVLIETLAGLFRKPLLRESLSGGSDLTSLLGDKTVNSDGSIGFDAAQLVKAAEDGCWVVLDEINAIPQEFVTSLHSILETDIKAINVNGYKYVKAAPDFRVLATMNPADSNDYIVNTLSAATASRFKTLEIVSNVGFEEVLKNACPDADAKDVKDVARVYNALKKIYDARQTELSAGFLAIRRYIEILNDEVAIEFTSLKERCIDNLVQADSNDRVQCEIVLQTINDCLGK